MTYINSLRYFTWAAFKTILNQIFIRPAAAVEICEKRMQEGHESTKMSTATAEDKRKYKWQGILSTQLCFEFNFRNTLDYLFVL